MQRQTGHTGRLAAAALMSAMTAVCAQIQIPLPAVPISLALFAVLLCGALLEPRVSLLAMGAYVLLGAAGLPVYAGFLAGPSVLFGPTGGFLFGYALCAPAVGLLLRRLGFTRKGLVLSMIAAAALCYVSGLLWFIAVTGSGLRAALAACVLPFLPGDALKIALASSLALRLKKALPHL